VPIVTAVISKPTRLYINADNQPAFQIVFRSGGNEKVRV